MRILALIAALSCLPAAASTPEAWDEHYRHVAEHCLRASKAPDARAVGRLLLFSDGLGTALRLRGTRRAGQPAEHALCVHRRGQDTLEVEWEADGVALPRKTP